jgi:hypothetical protein
VSDQFKTYLFSYRYKNAIWGFDLKAESPEDAKERLKALAWATYNGELMATIPDNPASRIFVPLVCAVRNLWGRRKA